MSDESYIIGGFDDAYTIRSSEDKHTIGRTVYSVGGMMIMDNHGPIYLTWEEEVFDPKLRPEQIRNNQKEAEFAWQKVANDSDAIDMLERKLKCQNIFTNM